MHLPSHQHTHIMVMAECNSRNISSNKDFQYCSIYLRDYQWAGKLYIIHYLQVRATRTDYVMQKYRELSIV